MQRKIIHVDCDCFYAAVEMRDDPQLRNRPLAVGGRADRRGVVATCNYEARAFGVHSAMSSQRALALCPQLLIVPPDMARYRQVAAEVRGVFERYTERIEPLSLDEAYLDVSGSLHFNGSATRTAAAIRAAVREEIGITVSAGVAANKFLAKVASDWRKPDGLFVIEPGAAEDFLARLPVTRLPGVGRVTASRLAALGVQTCAELRELDPVRLGREFGRFGQRLFELARGVDEREVKISRERKSVSVEHTFEHDLPDLEACIGALEPLLEQLHTRLQRAGELGISKQFVKLKFDNFEQTTMECVSTRAGLARYRSLCSSAWERQRRPVRLLGVGVRLAPRDPLQLPLFRR